MLPIYFTLAVLQREAHCAWAYVKAPLHAGGDYEHVADAWRFGVVDSRMRYASAHLDRCPEAFFDVLRPRVADACTNARIGVCSALRCMQMCTDADAHSGAIRDAPAPSLSDLGACEGAARPYHRGR